MNKYNEEQVLKIAKRYKNNKRKYLLVDPFQAKHIPVSPKTALELMDTLGKAVREKYPEAFPVIGFAETATAIASVIAENLKDCVYVQTTREDIENGGEFLEFEELHSHAVEQRLCIKNIVGAILDSPQIIFVDDEISTGNTLLNIVSCLRGRYPEISDKKIVIASVIDRVSDENRKKLTENNIECISLCKIREQNYDCMIGNIDAEAPDPRYFNTDTHFCYTKIETVGKLSDPAGIASYCGTHEDFLIASACLNSVVSGLLSRTFYRSDIIGAEDFHGVAFYDKLIGCDIDISAFLPDADGKVIGDDWFVFYGQTDSPDGSVHFSDRSQYDREEISVDLTKLSSSVKKMVFVLTIYDADARRMNFSMVSDAYIRILDSSSKQEIVSFKMDEYYPNVLSMIIGELYIHNGAWKFNAVGNGIAKGLDGLCELYVVQLI